MSQFTVCIPTYNRAHTIGRTLESLRNQTCNDFEILVIDDGSSDDTRQVVSSYETADFRIRYLFKPNGGKHTALNRGIAEAQGELFLILDSDDVLVPEALEEMKNMWALLADKANYCGIMGKCGNLTEEDHPPLGEPFPSDPFSSSYIDFHFGSGFKARGNRYGDCCECIRTDILKQYRYPEQWPARFVPESFIMDLIGLEYKLICTNRVFEYKEYLKEGITRQAPKHREQNISGFLVKYVSNIEDILPVIHPGFLVRLKMWKNYWDAVYIDAGNTGPRLTHISMFGKSVHLLISLLNGVAQLRK